MAGMTADNGGGLGLAAHVTGTFGQDGVNSPSPAMAWCLIVGAVVVLALLGVGLRSVRI